MITIEKSDQISKSLEEFYKAILPSESYQRRKNMQIMATEEDSFHRNVSKPFLDYMRLKIIQDIRRAVIKAKTTPTIFTEFVDWEDIGTKGKQLSKPAYVKILDKSGTQAAVVARVEAGFDVMNVNSIKWAEKYSAGMVTQVTNETKKALRAVITDGMKHKYNKLKIARQINKMPIGLNLKQTQALHNFRDKLITDGASAKLVEKRVQSYYNRLLRQRSRSIARTETSRAVNEGYLQGLEQQNVYRRVRISMAADACHLCTEHAGRIFTIAEAHAFLPIHPHCRCAWVVVYSKRPSSMPPVWKPTMTQAEADEWAKGSQFADDTFYHGTNKTNAARIGSEGFKVADIGKNTCNGGMFGSGNYVTQSKSYASKYGDLSARGKGELLKVKVNLKNVLTKEDIIRQIGMDSDRIATAGYSSKNLSLVEARKKASPFIKDSLNLINEKEWVKIKTLLAKERYGVESIRTFMFQKNGYDGVYHKAYQEFVIFNDTSLVIIK